MALSTFLFIVLGILAIASAIVTISHKNPVMSALGLIFHFFMLAGLYLNLNAQFLAVIQILVYAGAIMVLVLFVIMLLNLGDEEKLREKFNVRKGIAILLATSLVVQLIIVFFDNPIANNTIPEITKETGTVEGIGKILFTNYLFPFEAISLLLLAAIVGAVFLAKKRLN